MSGYSYGPAVQYRIVPHPNGIAEQLLATTCPTCGTDWTKPGTKRVGHAAGREYQCHSCHVFHRGTLVDDQGEPLPTPGAGLARELRTHESGPDRRP